MTTESITPPRSEPGFLGRLFDTSFTSFITLSIIQLLFKIFIGLAALSTAAFVVVAFAADPAVGVVALILGPLLFLLYVILVRIYLELVVVFFRIEENTRSRNG